MCDTILSRRRAVNRRWLRALVPAVCVALAACSGGSSSSVSSSANAPYAVSGVITAAVNSAVDGDTNDPLAPLTDNSDINSPQPIPNPVVLGGYANIASCGTSGVSTLKGDVHDYYRVSLQAGQTVTLFVAQAGTGTFPCGINNLDLYLYRYADVQAGNTTPLESSAHLSSTTEAITIAAAGDYIVEVRAVNGASNYILSTGLTSAAALAGDFVPGDVLVRFKSPPAVAVTGVQTRAATLGMDVVAGGAGTGPVLMHLRRGETLRALGVTTPWVGGGTDQQLKVNTLLAVRALRGRADVTSADVNYIRKPLVQPGDPLFAQQWDAQLINLPQAWDISQGSSQVIVAVLDTGVLPNHPDLQGKLVTGYDFISDAQNALDGDGIDPDPTDPGDQSLGGSSSFHGTHVTGIIAAATDNGVGVAGTGWQTRVMPLRVLGKNGGTSFDMCQALNYAAGLANDSSTLPARRADIVNMSFGGPGASQTEQDCINSARNAGVILIAAAGNDGDSAPIYPAAYNGVVSVSAVNLSKQLASYSNYGPTIDVAAPGGAVSGDVNGDGNPDGILSTVGNDSSGTIVLTYGYYAGTSMAAPHVAGVAALMKAVDPGMTPDQFDTWLSSGQLTDDLGVPGRDDSFGDGLINAYKSVTVASTGGSGSLNPLLGVNPPGINFGLTQPSATLTVSNGGGGTLMVSDPSEDSGGWLTLIKVSVDANGIGSYAVTVDRGGLAVGTYTATISFTSNGGDKAVPVIMQVPDANTSLTADAGYHYVLLVDPKTGKTVDTVAASVANGVYQFTFTGVPAGSYQIMAGTDMNNDGFICDTGEACGAYTTLDLPTTINVDADQSGRDFVTGFFYNLSTASVSAVSSAQGQRRLAVTAAGQ